MHEDLEAILGALTRCHWTSHLLRFQRGGVENDLTRISHTGFVFEDLLELIPTDAWAIFLPYLQSFGGNMGVQGLAGVFGCELDSHIILRGMAFAPGAVAFWMPFVGARL